MGKIKTGMTILMLLSFTTPTMALAQPLQDHVVQPEEWSNKLLANHSEREANIEEIRNMLRHDLVREQVGKLVDLEKVEVSVATLDDETLARLAQQSKDVNDQLGAGVSSWVIIIVVSAVLLVVLLLV